MATILIIDDDTAVLAGCRVGLHAMGHEVRTAGTGSGGLADAAVHPPDVIVLDLGLPDVDGMQVCGRLRSWTDTPVIVLSADDSEDRKVEALSGGADDYVTKPFGMRELDAWLRVALRHHATEETEHTTRLDAARWRSIAALRGDLQGERIDLTPKEFEFLAFLARHVGKVCTRRMILEKIWGPGHANEHDYLKVYAYRIHKKLGDERGQFLQNDPSVGYRLPIDQDGT